MAFGAHSGHLLDRGLLKRKGDGDFYNDQDPFSRRRECCSTVKRAPRSADAAVNAGIAKAVAFLALADEEKPGAMN